VGIHTQISPADYLSTSFPDLDKEYVHGELVERSMPDTVHAGLQAEISGRFRDAKKRGLGIWILTELRLQLEPDVFRIPDVCVFEQKPLKPVPDSPPLIAIEIVSQDDRYTALLAKLEEYRRFGIANVWVVDPELRRLSVYDAAGLRPVEELTFDRLGIHIRIDELLSSIE
jgi:Uma2 family endonuclease